MSLSRHSVGTYQGDELKRSSPGNVCPQSSQLTEPLWTEPGLKRGIEVRELSPLKESRQGAIRKIFPKIFACEI